MTDCPTCGYHVDGMVCPKCHPPRAPTAQRRTPPPMGWEAIYAKVGGRPTPLREPGEDDQ